MYPVESTDSVFGSSIRRRGGRVSTKQWFRTKNIEDLMKS